MMLPARCTEIWALSKQAVITVFCRTDDSATAMTLPGCEPVTLKSG